MSWNVHCAICWNSTPSFPLGLGRSLAKLKFKVSCYCYEPLLMLPLCSAVLSFNVLRPVKLGCSQYINKPQIRGWYRFFAFTQVCLFVCVCASVYISILGHIQRNGLIDYLTDWLTVWLSGWLSIEARCLHCVSVGLMILGIHREQECLCRANDIGCLQMPLLTGLPMCVGVCACVRDM